MSNGRVRRSLEALLTVGITIVAASYVRLALVRVASGGAAKTVTVSGQALTRSVLTHVLGSSTLVLVEFADYECPYCARHAESVFPRIRRELVDEGELQFVYLHYPLQSIHQNAFGAAVAAECAAIDGRFWEMHERLFAMSRSLTAPTLIGLAKALKLDVDRFASCLGDPAAVAEVRRQVMEGRRLRVESTPTFFMGYVRASGGIDLTRRITGLVSLSELKQVARDVRAEAGQARRVFGPAADGTKLDFGLILSHQGS